MARICTATLASRSSSTATYTWPLTKQLLKIDAATGVKLAQAPLAGSIGYTTRPVYAQGVVMVPLDGGAVPGAYRRYPDHRMVDRRSQLKGPIKFANYRGRQLRVCRYGRVCERKYLQ